MCSAAPRQSLQREDVGRAVRLQALLLEPVQVQAAVQEEVRPARGHQDLQHPSTI